MTTTDPAVSEEERKKKSVYYNSCTSAFKDDLPVLVTCLRSDKGDPHTRQEAGFLLWHHALEGDDVPGLLNAGILSACIANLDSPPTALLPAERACSAGILLSLATGSEEVSEQLVRARAPSGRPALEVLHAHLREDAAVTRQYCCRLLHLLAKQVPAVMLKSMDNGLPYLPAYLGVWGFSEHRDAPVVTAVCCMVALLVQARPPLAEALVSGGAVSALLDVLRKHKSEAACSGALTLLLRLLPQEAAAKELADQGGIALLIDMVGPPPRIHPPPPPPEEDPEPVSPPAAPASPSTSSPPLPAAEDAVSSPRLRVSPPRASTGAGDGPARSGHSLIAGEAPGRSGHSLTAATAVAVADGEAAEEVSSPRVGGIRQSLKDSGSASPASGPRSPVKGRSEIMSGPSSSTLQGIGTSTMSVASSVARVQLPLVIPGIHSQASAAGLCGEPSTLSLGGASHTAFSTSHASLHATASRTSRTTAHADARDGESATILPPPLPPPDDLPTNRCGLRWLMLPGLEVASLAVACLTSVVQQRPEHLAETENRLVSHRIIAQVKSAIAAAAAGSAAAKTAGKTKKNKGLGLTVEQTAGLTRVLGHLKFLSLTNATRYRIAKLGAVPALVRLYGEGSDYLLRNHCQAILSNVALLAENGQALKDAKTPEEFLVANPMRLSDQERFVLRLEFPDDPVLLPTTAL